jgi:hypothetical protein
MSRTQLAVLKSKWDRKQSLKDKLIIGSLILR